MLYDNWLGNITKRFQEKFDAIKTTHNFEYGDEFEMAIAEALRELLPRRFGVCRGYVVARTGQRAGDDIIIFDAQRFPTLRALERTDLARKEDVPAEAVLAYIEAKHTLKLTGDGGQTLTKATEQVRLVKEIPRPAIQHHQLIHGVNLVGPFHIDVGPGMPAIRNPYYGAIWARFLERDEDGAAAMAYLLGHETSSRLTRPDAIVAGKWMTVPARFYDSDGARRCSLAQFMTESTRWALSSVPDAPWGTALAHMLWALEWIRLSDLPWAEMFREQVAAQLLDIEPEPSKTSDSSPSRGVR